MKTTPEIRALRAELAEILREIRAARRQTKPSVRSVLTEAAAAAWKGAL